MPNVQLSDSRQRLGSAIIYSGCIIGLGGCFAGMVLRTNLPLVVGFVGVSIVFAGTAFVTIKVVCAKCGRRHWISGKPTRLNCAFCGAPYFNDPPAPEKAG